ncbi:MAG: N-formylglutamate amidohydrolase [Rhodobiaceae bacterium]|nr:N-formylglutamate amidohydrolase [Rhodobiaceae bacterium]
MPPSVKLLIVADHASNYIPKKYDNLGLTKKDVFTHKVFDSGIKDLAINLSNKFNSHLVLGEYSRLLIDCNRDVNDPTLISVISDRTLILGNKKITNQERIYRINKMYRPYHDKINKKILEKKINVIISLHSFNPIFKGRKRFLKYGILSNEDRRLSNLIINELKKKKNFVGDNEPYRGSLIGDTLYKHALKKGIYHSLIEIRNDLLSNVKKIDQVSNLMYRVINNSIKSLPITS